MQCTYVLAYIFCSLILQRKYSNDFIASKKVSASKTDLHSRIRRLAQDILVSLSKYFEEIA